MGISIGDKKQGKKFFTETRVALDKGIEGRGGHYFSGAYLPLDGGSKVWVYRSCPMSPRTTNEVLDEAVSGLEKEISSRFVR